MGTDDAGREVQPRGSKVERSGGVSVQLTASEFVALAVNRQNGWDYPDWVLDVLGCESIETLNAMLDEIYEQILVANRRAVVKRLAREAGQDGETGQVT